MKNKLFGCLLLIFLSSKALALVLDANSSDKSLFSNQVKITSFADSVFECGIYYQYTARGMEKNPNIPSETIESIAHNAETLLGTANQLYQSVGISTKAKYDELILQAKTIIQARENSESGISDLIFERGEKCRLLLVNYPAKLREISGLLKRN